MLAQVAWPPPPPPPGGAGWRIFSARRGPEEKLDEGKGKKGRIELLTVKEQRGRKKKGLKRTRLGTKASDEEPGEEE